MQDTANTTDEFLFNASADSVPNHTPALGMIGESARMRALRRSILQFAPIAAPVLVTGETGVGKELAARALHDASPRSGGPFVAINAATIPATLVASELFGHVRGAFTGATSGHRGVFEQAHGGTLLLDEVGELPLDLQAWLLRVLETGEVRALGAERARRIDVRVIASTHSDLELAVEARRFRADLFWRLAVLELVVPPLRERKEDIAALAQHILRGLDAPPDLTPDALQVLTLHDWPGNVRQLRSVLVRAAARATRQHVDAVDIMGAIGRRFAPADSADSLYEAVVAAGGNVAAAARRLGLSRSTVRDRLRRRTTTGASH